MDKLQQQILDTINPELEIIQDDIHAIKKNIENLSKPEKPFQILRPVGESDGSAIKSILDFPVSTTLPGTSAATATNYGIFFVADKACEVTSVRIRYTTAGTDAGAVTLQIEKLNGTDALDGGDVILATALSLKATANTTYSGTLVVGTARNLSYGDALALKDAGVLTAVAGLCVTVTVKYI